jgi:hypothetical protein
MALLDYIQITQGAAIVWGEAGAPGVTATLSFNGLANGAAIMGASVDLTENWEDEYMVYFSVETGTAPSPQTTIEAYLLSSWDNTTWPAKVTGSAGSYTLGSNDVNLRQAGPPTVSLIATADLNTVITQFPVIWRPRGRYVVPIVDNNLGQALRARTPNSDNLSRLTIVPRRLVRND